ncbi:hypothetical protein SKAU_G00173500 [Synaphobranchus kaupii]|uniref:Uncharacterized protein n=1 Tax=Synaphobranchus kaupii TaxID=118154 RepID=A0A9Q1J0Y4_SYNKA|nr:hypothetical protein SKAU_G00173500 [Synaphobranchus kaupii]
MDNTPRETVSKLRVCSDHFTQDDCIRIKKGQLDRRLLKETCTFAEGDVCCAITCSSPYTENNRRAAKQPQLPLTGGWGCGLVVETGYEEAGPTRGQAYHRWRACVSGRSTSAPRSSPPVHSSTPSNAAYSSGASSISILPHC